MNEGKLEDINIEVVENGWLVEVDREDEPTEKHVFERQEEMVRFINGQTGGLDCDLITDEPAGC